VHKVPSQSIGDFGWQSFDTCCRRTKWAVALTDKEIRKIFADIDNLEVELSDYESSSDSEDDLAQAEGSRASEHD
jgi:hypothetical protein